MSRDKVAAMIKDATGWSYTRALAFRRDPANIFEAHKRALADGVSVAQALIDAASEQEGAS